MGWLSGLAWCFAGIGGIGLTCGVFLYVFQDRLLYIPQVPVRDPDDNPLGIRNPLEQGISYEDMHMTALDGVTIHGWLLKNPDAHKVPTLVFLHGNAGNIGFRLTNARHMQLATGCNVLLVDYRGYGKSKGHPTEEGLILDVEASLRALRDDAKSGVDTNKIVLFGRSLGGAVALGAAERYPDLVRAVIVENTFLSVSHMVDVVLPMLSSVKWLVLRLKWNSEDRARSLKRPILFISGLRDELVPPWHMQALYNVTPEKTGGGKRLIIVPDGAHNDTWERGGQDYLRALKSFISEVMAGKMITPVAASCSADGAARASAGGAYAGCGDGLRDNGKRGVSRMATSINGDGGLVDDSHVQTPVGAGSVS